MARRVFFSFHYENDINRSMVVRNSWVTQGKEAAGFIDKAEFEKIKRQGVDAVHKWIDSQLHGTSVTVVLIGSETLERPFVQYEICQSLNKGNAVIGVYIDRVVDFRSNSNVVNLSPGQASELKNCPCCCGSIYAPAAAHDGRNAFPV